MSFIFAFACSHFDLCSSLLLSCFRLLHFATMDLFFSFHFFRLLIYFGLSACGILRRWIYLSLIFLLLFSFDLSVCCISRRWIYFNICFPLFAFRVVFESFAFVFSFVEYATMDLFLVFIFSIVNFFWLFCLWHFVALVLFESHFLLLFSVDFSVCCTSL